MEHGTDVCPGVEGLALMVATRLFGFRFEAGQRSCSGGCASPPASWLPMVTHDAFPPGRRLLNIYRTALIWGRVFQFKGETA